MVFFRSTKTFLDAAAAGNIAVLKDYLANDPASWCEARDKATGDNALHKACAAGKPDAVELLLEKSPATAKCRQNKDRLTPLGAAIVKGHTGIVGRLLADKHVLAYCAMTPEINRAIEANRVDILRDLIATGKADLAADNPPALYFAVDKNRPECVAFLLGLGANPNVPHMRGSDDPRGDFTTWRRRCPSTLPKSPLFRAIQLGHTGLVEELLHAGACVAASELPLHKAVAEGTLRMVELVLSSPIVPLSGEIAAPPVLGQDIQAKRPDINAVNMSGKSALHLAVAANKPELVKFLLNQGANAALADRSLAQTPLSIAQQYGMTEIITILRGPVPAKRVPEILPVKPVIKAPAAKAPEPAPAAPEASATPLAPEMSAAPSTLGDSWMRQGANRLVHVENYPAHQRRLTEIFNFETRERTILSENISLKTEAIAPRESFDAVTEEALAKALAEFRRLGGAADEGQVFRNRLGKLKAGPG